MQRYLACSGEDCSFTKPAAQRAKATGVPCPQEGCDGELVERRGRHGKFFGCSNYPRCRYTTGQLPETGDDSGPPDDDDDE